MADPFIREGISVRGVPAGRAAPRLGQAVRDNFTYVVSLQLFFLTLSLFIYGIFWAIEPEKANLLASIIYTFCLANLTVLLQKGFNSFSTGRRPLQQWAAYLGLLLVCTPVMVTIATAVTFWLLAGPRDSLSGWLLHGWKFPSLATVGFGTLTQVYCVLTCRLEERNRQLESDTEQLGLQAEELKRAREIQQALLPKQIPQVDGFQIAGTWEPARLVGGDYFDVIRLSDTKLGICIADVVGKSVPAALLMANVQAAVRAFASESATPAWVCERVNSALCANIAPEKFVSLFYGVLDAAHKTLCYTSAGHPAPILLPALGQARQLENGGAILGVFPNWKYETSFVQLAPRDRLVLFTDGITEAAKPGGEQLGEQGLVRLLEALPEQPPAKLNAALLTNVKHFCASHLQDDATLICIAVAPAPAKREASARAA